MNRMIIDKESVIQSVLELWDVAGLDMPNRQRQLIAKAGENGNALAGSVIQKINDAIASSEPTEDGSRLLSEIDEFYVRRIEWSRSWMNLRKGSQNPHNRFVDVIQLISPLVYFDEIIAMKSFDDGFLSGMELAFLSRLNIPRNIEEAERTYDGILRLPKRFERRGARDKLSSDQPFRAQMFFAFLLMRETESGSELWRYLMQCLKTCPAYLLDSPVRLTSLKYSTRPAFWLSCIGDTDFQEVLLRRGSQTVKDSVNTSRDYARELEASASVVRSEIVDAPSPVAERVSTEQVELADLLTTFEAGVLGDLPELASRFENPVNDDQIDKLNHAIAPLMLTEDVEALYKWRNGFRSDLGLFGFPDFNPIEFAFHEYGQLAKALEESWSRVWFPLCGSGRWFRLALLSEEYAPDTPIFCYHIEDGELQLEFESLELMVKTYKDAYEAGISFFDDSIESFRADETAFEKLRLEINPRAYAYPNNQINKYDVWDPDGWPPLWRKHQVSS